MDWIEAKNRRPIPGEDGDYIVTVKMPNGTLTAGVLYFGQTLTGRNWGFAIPDEATIEAYMPLPKPYVKND